MANLAKALKTDALSDLDLKGLAQILQSRGRKNDKILAHISPREAEILKQYGGSGGINPATGLQEFAELDEFTAPPPPPPQPPSPVPTATETPAYSSANSLSPPQEISNSGMVNTVEPYGSFNGAAQPTPTAAQLPSVSQFPSPPAGADQAQINNLAPAQQQANEPQKPGFLSRTATSALNALQDPSNLLKLGLGAGTLGLGLSQQAAARKQAAQTQAQYAALGAPFQQRGQEMINAAQQGVLTPQSQQAYQAAQAQLNQQVANRGGVGAQQAAAQLGSLYNTLLNNQMSLGMSTVQTGDAYATQGIQAGLQANQQLQNMTQNYYATMMRMLVPATAYTMTPTK
jgi:hypothetical protein